jgi:hypothetical protein
VTSVGTDILLIVATFESGIGRLGSSGLWVVIGMFRRVSMLTISFSQYWTPTKYWFLLTGSIQKLCLLNEMLELNAATTFCMTSVWVNPSSAAFIRSTVTTYCG